MNNNQNIKEFIDSQREDGLKDQEIWNILIEAGHKKEDIDQYFSDKKIKEENFEPIHEKIELENEVPKDELGDFNDLSFDFIECSKDIYKRLIWKDEKWRTVLATLISLGFVIYAVNINHPSYFFVGFLVLPLYFAFLYRKANKEFYKEFSAKNNLRYKSSEKLSRVVGNLFKVGNKRRIEDVIIGRYGSNKAKFFHYRYSVGTSKFKKTFNFTVLEVFFDEIIFPHMLLQSKNRGVFWSGRHGKRGKNERSVALEDELEDYFNLYFQDGYGVEATQIFSEEFLRFLREEKSHFDIELKGGRLYIYDSTAVKRKEEFEELFRVAGKVINRITPILERLENDFDALNEYFLEAD